MTKSQKPVPLRRRLITPGAWMLMACAAAGICAGVYRLVFGLQSSTNLNHFYPWGIWIVADVSLIALAAGGFVTAAVAHVLHREQYHVLVRPALLTALLGYTFACVLLAADLGRYYNIWHPLLPSMWQGNSALFEVGMCVMTYLVVLCVEFIPVVCSRFIDDWDYPFLGRVCAVVNRLTGRIMPLVIVLGVGISCLHQSSLGHVFVLAPSKLHPLWWTPILSLLFLLSAVMVGLPTVIFVNLFASWAFRVAPPMKSLVSLARYLPLVFGIYLAFKIGDMLIRGSFVHLSNASLQSVMFLIELVPGLIVPLVMMMSARVRNSPLLLAIGSLLAMLGVVIYRTNVYWIGFQPVDAQYMYVPSISEWVFTFGVIAALILAWRFLAIHLPVVTPQPSQRTI